MAARYVRRHEPSDVAGLIEANVAFGVALLEAMHIQGCHRLVYAASAFQRSATPTGGARNLYAATKNAFEEILHYYQAFGGIDSIRLTVCDVYGEDDPRPRLMNALVSAAVDGSVLFIPHHDPFLIPVHVDDAVRAFVAACDLPWDSNGQRTYWVGPKDAVLLSELLDLVARLMGSPVKTERVDLPALPGDTLAPVPDSSLPNWDLKVSLEDGLGRMLSARRSGRR
jgi:nucleoside-diphosphate-sugar epimerase